MLSVCRWLVVWVYCARQLEKFDVTAEDVTWSRVTMVCDSFVCIRQRKIPQSHQQQVVFYFCSTYRQSLWVSVAQVAFLLVFTVFSGTHCISVGNASYFPLYSGWPLVWKTCRKCQGTWLLSGKCRQMTVGPGSLSDVSGKIFSGRINFTSAAVE